MAKQLGATGGAEQDILIDKIKSMEERDRNEAEKALPDQNVCLKVNVMEEKRLETKVLEVATLLDPG